MASKLVALEKFAFRQFAEAGSAARVGRIAFDKAAFEARVNEELVQQGGLAALKDGYAPFCKHVFVDNFCGAQCLDVAITPENERLLRTEYEARREGELPVLARYFREEDVAPIPVAECLDIILYSREQIIKENEAMGEPPGEETAPYGIISIKAQDARHELPMQPITMMRNALGKAEGGSGVPLDKDKYMASVNYWSTRAPIRATSS